MLCFCVGGCRIELKFSCFVLLAFCCIFTGVEGGAVCFLAVCLHELAHLAVLKGCGGAPAKIAVSALGCRVVLNGGRPLPDLCQAAVSLAGPIANWLSFLAAICLGLSKSQFAGASLALAVTHSLPVEPLDGGLALRYLLRSRLSADKTERICRAASALFLFPLAVLGFIVLLRTRYNYSLLALSLYLMLYLVLKWDYTQP